MIDGAITTVGGRACWSATLLDRRPGHRQALHFSAGIHIGNDPTSAFRWSLLPDLDQIPEHVGVGGGGVVAPDVGLRDAHGPGSDVDATANALAVGPTATAGAAEGLIAGDERILDGHGTGVVVEAAAEAVPAVATYGAGGPYG